MSCTEQIDLPCLSVRLLSHFLVYRPNDFCVPVIFAVSVASWFLKLSRWCHTPSFLLILYTIWATSNVKRRRCATIKLPFGSTRRHMTAEMRMANCSFLQRSNAAVRICKRMANAQQQSMFCCFIYCTLASEPWYTTQVLYNDRALPVIGSPWRSLLAATTSTC